MPPTTQNLQNGQGHGQNVQNTQNHYVIASSRNKYALNPLLTESSDPTGDDYGSSIQSYSNHQQQVPTTKTGSNQSSGMTSPINFSNVTDMVSNINLSNVDVKEMGQAAAGMLKSTISSVSSMSSGLLGYLGVPQVVRREANLDKGSDWYYDEAKGCYVDRMNPDYDVNVDGDQSAASASSNGIDDFIAMPPPAQGSFGQQSQQNQQYGISTPASQQPSQAIGLPPTQAELLQAQQYQPQVNNNSQYQQQQQQNQYQPQQHQQYQPQQFQPYTPQQYYQ
jgi:hypothetical protein